MELFWTEDLSVGYSLIDTQHKELLTRYNAILQACKAGRGCDEIVQRFDCLVEYLADHVEEEEYFMERFKFPDREAHIQKHRELFDHIREVRSELQENGANATVLATINHTLLNWLLNHVMQDDGCLGRFLAAQPA